jgi:hypothetical protein
VELANHFAAAPHVRMAAISLIVIAAGPERVVQRAREAAARLESPSTEVVIVPAGSMSPGAARNAGVRQSTGACFLIIDGSEQLPPNYASSALRALDTAPDAAFAAGRGCLPYVGDNSLVGAGSVVGAGFSRLGSGGRMILSILDWIIGPW